MTRCEWILELLAHNWKMAGYGIDGETIIFRRHTWQYTENAYIDRNGVCTVI